MWIVLQIIGLCFCVLFLWDKTLFLWPVIWHIVQFFGPILLPFLLVFYWANRKEKTLNSDPWKRKNGKIQAKMYWHSDSPEWRNLKFEMPVDEMKKLTGQAKNVMDSATKRAS